MSSNTTYSPRKSSYQSIASSIQSTSSSSSTNNLLSKAKAKMASRQKPFSDAMSIADNETAYEKQKAKAQIKQQRKEDYKRLGLDKASKFGLQGAGGNWQS